MASGLIVGFSWSDLNPLTWLGDGIAGVAADAWKAAMIALWSCGLWVLQLAFKIIDAFTTPDLSGGGPLGSVLPITMWLGASIAVLVMFIQLGAAFIRRDGQSLGRVLLGIGQFGLMWVGYLAIGAGLVTAADGLSRGILAATLHTSGWSTILDTGSWPRKVDDAVVATVLGISSILLLVPAAFAYLMIMLVREAALIILVATTPISAAGLLSETTKVWFWKSLRWFIATLMISPMCALVVGIGVQMASGVIDGKGDQTVASVGMAVVSTVIIAIGAVSPMVLFKLLAFVEPGTASGAALRQSWSDAGGLAGVMSGSSGSSQGASSSATESDGNGRSSGEGAAESQTQSRLMSALGAAGGAMQTATRMAHKAADLGSDVLGGAGVGHGGYAMGYADTAASRRSSGGSQPAGGGQDSAGDTPDAGATPPTPAPPAPPAPTPMGPAPTGPQAPAGGGGASAGAGAGAGEAAGLADVAAVAAL